MHTRASNITCCRVLPGSQIYRSFSCTACVSYVTVICFLFKFFTFPSLSLQRLHVVGFFSVLKLFDRIIKIAVHTCLQLGSSRQNSANEWQVGIVEPSMRWAQTGCSFSWATRHSSCLFSVFLKNKKMSSNVSCYKAHRYTHTYIYIYIYKIHTHTHTHRTRTLPIPVKSRNIRRNLREMSKAKKARNCEF